MAEETTSDPWGAWRGRISASRRRRDDRVSDWQDNVNARKGELGHTGDGSQNRPIIAGRVSVNQDWPLTKAKIAQLYSQTPEVRLTPRYPELQQAIPVFGRELNDTISDAGVGSTIEEILSDVVNAAGIGAVLVSCETRTEPRDVPMVDPSMVSPEMQAQIPTTTVDAPMDIRYLVQRISPADLLVPDDFTGSNYDQARWLGEDGRMTWTQAVTNLGLTDDVKDKVLGKDKRAGSSGASLNTDSTSFRDTDVVNYTQIFYWRHFYHPEETSFKALQRLVFVDGLEEPPVNDPYRAQKRLEQGMAGVIRNPIRVCTLTYISDESLPPSDSSISRLQVDELTQSRDAMVQQRKHSIPIRWYDPSRISKNTQSLLEKGTFQGFIPTMGGAGDRAVGEVSRASFPQERFEFDSIIKNDLAEQWQVGTNQAGAFASGERSASEAKIVQSNFQTRVGQERDKVTKFFIGIAEVLAGHLCLYGQFQVPDQLGIQREALATGFTYSVRTDSTVRQDAQQRIDQLEKMINYLAQSPYANVKPLVQEYVELNGVDPTTVVIDPQPKPPEPIKVSVSKAEDVNDPMFLALLMRTHQAPTPDELQAAVKLMTSVRGLVPPPPVETTGEGNAGAERQPIANADWQEAPKINKRGEDNGA